MAHLLRAQICYARLLSVSVNILTLARQQAFRLSPFQPGERR